MGHKNPPPHRREVPEEEKQVLSAFAQKCFLTTGCSKFSSKWFFSPNKSHYSEVVLPKVQEPQGGACSVEHLSLVDQSQCFVLASALKIAAAGCKVYFFIHNKRLVILQGWKSNPAQTATPPPPSQR